MTNPFDSLIKELRHKMDNVNLSESGGRMINGLQQKGLLALLTDSKLITNNQPSTNVPELKEIIYAFLSQHNYTENTNNLLKSNLFNNADIGKLTTATNLIQLYFQGTQPLGQILSNLIDSIENLVQSSLNGVTFDQFRQSVKQILDDRQALQKTLNRVLREFGTEIDEQDLQKLLQRSSTILNELNNLNPTGFEDLSPLVQEFIAHLKKAQELFKKFNRQDEDLTGNEPDEIKQLIINWGDAIRQIEKIEQTDPEIKNELNNDVSKNREAIAQSIKIHELLEQNYDYLTTLVRSGDLESAGIL
ncbi:hypothetical protein BV378_06985 [Nostoc sp. RF31YmG]|nr:hypothetical protein BV378_06985 [Nostoc sp. RF31YmG]